MGGEITVTLFALCLDLLIIQLVRILNITIVNMKEEKLREQIINELKAKGVEIKDEYC